ncbi:TetR/AcrR family transcriptional regulator [Nocardioides sp.]|uniref:TetR/AcrR family transcriptional regulator n=1 Tax=Nocardioides sp. TaxID=35761 RepID=UPI0035177397
MTESGSGSRRRYGGKTAEERREERRDQVLRAGLAIWQEQGWAAVTMRGVCSRAGLTDRYFYESFRDRDDLLGTLFDQVRDETLASLLTAFETAGDRTAGGQLRQALQTIVTSLTEDPERAQVLFGDHAGSAVLEQRRRDTVALTTDLMVTLARPFLRADTDESALRVDTLFGLGGFVEVVLAWRAGAVPLTPAALVAHFAEVGSALAARHLDPDLEVDGRLGPAGADALGSTP